MTHGVSYFIWRGGRPRWEPGPTVRQRGFSGRDLKFPNGKWLPLEAALDEARRLNEEAGVGKRAKGRKSRSGADEQPFAQGYVYFLRSGEQIKVGFSGGPYSRLRSLSTGLSFGVSAIGAVSGTRADERQIHNEFADLKIHGEWFHARWRLRLFLANCVAAGKLVWGKTGRTL